MAITFGSEYIYNSGTTNCTDVVMMDDTHFVVAYEDASGSTRYIKVVVGEVGTDGSITFGTPYTIDSYDSSYYANTIRLTPLSSTKFVVAYCDSYHGAPYVRAITISGNSIYQVGGAVTLGSRAWVLLTTLDSTHFVAYYEDVSYYYLYLRVGAVSGTSISLGTEYWPGSDSGWMNGIGTIDSTHFIYSWQRNGNGYARVGTVSGTSITFGSTQSIVSNNRGGVGGNGIGMLDSTHAVLAYLYDGGNYDGRATILTISGDTITRGGIYAFNYGSKVENLDVSVLDNSHFIVTYRDSGNSYYGTAIRGTVSGTSISFEDETAFNQASTYYITNTKQDSSHFIVSYSDSGNSSYGTVIRGTTPQPEKVYNSIFFGNNF